MICDYMRTNLGFKAKQEEGYYNLEVKLHANSDTGYMQVITIIAVNSKDLDAMIAELQMAREIVVTAEKLEALQS